MGILTRKISQEYAPKAIYIKSDSELKFSWLLGNATSIQTPGFGFL